MPTRYSFNIEIVQWTKYISKFELKCDIAWWPKGNHIYCSWLLFALVCTSGMWSWFAAFDCFKTMNKMFRDYIYSILEWMLGKVFVSSVWIQILWWCMLTNTIIILTIFKITKIANKDVVLWRGHTRRWKSERNFEAYFCLSRKRLSEVTPQNHSQQRSAASFLQYSWKIKRCSWCNVIYEELGYVHTGGKWQIKAANDK